MPAQYPNLAEQTFHELLTAAITHGHRPQHTTAVGPTCWVAIDVLAREHPDAMPEHIVAAYEAFAFDHENTDSTEALADTDPVTARAVEYAALDALVAQLNITYPNIDAQTVAAIVRRIHADLSHRDAPRAFIALRVEHDAHRQLG
jgi:hypothetical protein